jgi:hypothetical protein
MNLMNKSTRITAAAIDKCTDLLQVSHVESSNHLMRQKKDGAAATKPPKDAHGKAGATVQPPPKF